MFDRAEYSDLYKFLTSIGLLLIASSFLLPWLFLKESPSISFSQVEYDGLMIDAQQLVTSKIKLSQFAYFSIQIISPLLFLGGIVALWYGLTRWFRKQKRIDEIDQIDLIQRRAQITPIASTEYKEKAEKELSNDLNGSEVGSDVPTDAVSQQTKDEKVERILDIETQVFDRLEALYSYDYRLQRNVKIANKFPVDVLMTTYNTSKKQDKIIEIKHFGDKLKMETVVSAKSTLKSFQGHYKRTTYRNADLVIIVVYNPESGENIPKFQESIRDNIGSQAQVVVVSEKAIDTLEIKGA